jgi:hypothetical protein
MFFRKNKSKEGLAEDIISPQFVDNIRTAIKVLSELEGTVTDEQILQSFRINHIESRVADQLLIYLPIAFCRRLLPDLKWRDDYSLLQRPSTVIVRRKFSQNKVYALVWTEVLDYYSGNPDSTVILRIAGRSSEFRAINELLNAGGKLEEMVLIPMCIIL